jgi:serine protease inhibitor
MGDREMKIVVSFLTAGLLILSNASAQAKNGSVSSSNKTGLELASAVVQIEFEKSQSFKNFMVSPVSAYSAFSMLNAGLRGQTQLDLQNYLGVSASDAVSMHTNNKLFSDALRFEAKRVAAVAGQPQEKQEPIVGIYNSAWSTNNLSKTGVFEFNAPFKSILSASYDAEIRSIDFADEKGADVINAWANTKTRSLIPQVIDAATLKDLVWVLMNATYLEANWRDQFSAIPARYAPKFTQLNGLQLDVDSIKAESKFLTEHTADLDMIEVPLYRSDLAFYVVQPNDVKKYQAMQNDLNSAAFWNTTLANFAVLRSQKIVRPDVSFSLPKFDFGFSVTMRDGDSIVTKLGLNSLFNSQRAIDFTPLGILKLFKGPTESSVVGIVKQDTKIQLDENGIKAAAVTLIGGIRATSVQQPRPMIPFVVDKPFQFAIASTSTGAVLFVGSVVNPKEK